MTTIKAIETEYAGCRFRSRLEARWAVFFDHLGIRWQHEPEGFELAGGGRYLPDFYFPDSPRIFVEVKGHDEALIEDSSRIQAFSEQAFKPVLVLGPIPEEPPADVAHSVPVHLMVWPDKPLSFAVFMTGIKSKLITLHGACDWTLFDDPLPGLRATLEVENAYRAARSARFEFGARG